MTELEIDQSHLPRVQEVCQCFAVLEDGALAHNLQEQEIEQYYTTNIQKNQLVQNDIRIAKRLQDEEEEQRAQQRARLSQATRRLEEQDSEYARRIQEEIQRCADEEAYRREQEDEEIAKRIQEEEEHRVRQRSSVQESFSEEGASDPASASPRQRPLSSPPRTGQHQPPSASRWQSSTSHTHSHSTALWADSPRPAEAQNNRIFRSNNDHTASFRRIRNDLREPGYLSDLTASEDTDTVIPAQLTSRALRPEKRLNTASRAHQDRLHDPGQRDCRGLQDSFRGKRRAWGDWEGVRGDLEGGRRDVEEMGESQGGWGHRRDNEAGDSSYESHGMRGRSRHSGDLARRVNGDEARDTDEVRDGGSLRDRDGGSLRDGGVERDRDGGRSWTYREGSDRRVHFQDQSKRCHSYHGDRSSRVWEMLGQVLRERGVAVRFQSGSLQVRRQARDSLVLDGSDVSYSDTQSQQRVFQRATPSRRSYHGDGRERRKPSHRGERDGGSGGGPTGDHDNTPREEHCGPEFWEEEQSWGGIRERSGSQRRRRDGARSGRPEEKPEERPEERPQGRRDLNEHTVRRSVSERWHGHKEEEEEAYCSEEEQERREERPRSLAVQRSQSFCSRGASTRARARHGGAGAGLKPEGACLDMGELQQVLLDEELARRLQEEEERLLRGSPQPTPSPLNSYPEGDFRVAQVAQDEEIARFMQKQEMKSKRQSRELDVSESWRGPREPSHPQDRRPPRERQRERLDSEGFPSPSEDCSPDQQPPSPTSTGLQAFPIRNIAEELDPTFKAKRQSKDSLREGQTISGSPACQSPPVPHSGRHDFLEEPAFIPPTKRHSDKSGCIKPKEKKNCKQQ
ncbi:coiled-coil domain-containing protein 187 isoform X2 [Hypomesus transpacificus]|uniref:coiled-coil domain-containing protein 187 isoform X2 n=1 Tax=Hypomesus transpacificus TaxID=137520 RepID=UPI001F072E72|nr:coiled-coil domain-containing protein 187 isoform X2 [Hypomesus transpacificus]